MIVRIYRLKWSIVRENSHSGRPSGRERNRFGGYVVGDQVLWRWREPEQNRHLGAFGAFTLRRTKA